jgi:transcriptional regulator with XRE-family HTH domain
LRRLELAERVIELRERAKLTQGEAAKRAGVGVTTWSNIETGTITRPHARTLIKIARALGVEPEELTTSPKAGAPEPPDTFVDRLLRAPGPPIEEQSDEALQNYRENILRQQAGDPPAAYFEEESPALLDFPPEQVEAWRQEQERENEWIRRELESMSKRELIELVLSTSPRLKKALRQAEEDRRQRARDEARNETA